MSAIEKRFCREMFERIGLDPASLPSFDDPAQWGPAKEMLTAHFRSRPRDAWIALLVGSDSRSEEHTSELQSLMRISYAVFCMKNNNANIVITLHIRINKNT